jgi:hypothetical protein
LSVSAKLRATLSPSDELIENPVPLTVLVKLVETFVTFAVLVATSDAIEELNEVNEPDIIVGVNAFTNAIVANSESINAPAAATFVASVTSANNSIPSSLFFRVVVKFSSDAPLIPVIPLPSPANEPVKDPVNGSVNVSNCVELLIRPDGNCAEPLIIFAGKFANTFVASVTSADASIASNLFFNVVVKSFAV